MMQEAINNFAKQFAYEPEVLRGENLFKTNKYLVCGMGGSHLAADLLKAWDPSLDIVVHMDYGLPALPDIGERLVILSSYSGNTEEVLDAFHEAKEKGLHMAGIAVGGELETQAQEATIPFIKMPDTGIQPRSGIGFSIKGLMVLMGLTNGLEEVSTLATTLNSLELEAQGKVIAESLMDKVPVIYTSSRFLPIAYNWKIKFNETGKIPAFYNVFPELNHNEMTGFDTQTSNKRLSERFSFILIKDKELDHQRVQKRMDILTKQYKDRGLPVQTLELTGKTIFEKIFTSLIIADWAAVHTAANYGLEAEQVPMVEEFKQLMKS